MAMQIRIKRDGWGGMVTGGVYKVPTSVGRVMVRQGYGDEVKPGGDKSDSPRKRRRKKKESDED
jgi:hypothetical protein